MSLCHIRVDTIDPFNKWVELVSITLNPFDLSDPFNEMTFHQYTLQTLGI